jgi:hypothetical protein
MRCYYTVVLVMTEANRLVKKRAWLMPTGHTLSAPGKQ